MRHLVRRLAVVALSAGMLSAAAYANEGNEVEAENGPATGGDVLVGRPTDGGAADGPAIPSIKTRRMTLLADRLKTGRKGMLNLVRVVDAPKKEKAAYLGISTSPASGALREQLKLPNGIGLVVDMVENDSPAAQAGLKRYDVLHKLNDQILVNPQQLAVLVRSFKSGEEVKLTIIRQGESRTLTARLVEKEVPSLEDGDPFGMSLPMHKIEGLPFPGELGKLDVMAGPENGDFLWMMNDGGDFQMSWADPEHVLRLSTEPGKGKHLVVEDKAGNRTFEGNVADDAVRKQLPEAVLRKLERMEEALKNPIHVEVEPTTQPTMQIRVIKKGASE